jgi:hypothetical protein
VPTNRYNGNPPELEKIPAGTRLYRIYPADATYAANSFNPKPRRLGHPKQGRFEPTIRTLGGYLYASPSLAGAVAEGILRNVNIPASGIVRRSWLLNKHIAYLDVHEDIEVASLYGPHTASLNLDSSFLCCDWAGYSETRRVGTKILRRTPAARGIRYRCRSNDNETSLMLVERGNLPNISVHCERDVFFDPKGRQLILDTLDRDFKLRYVGAIP